MEYVSVCLRHHLDSFQVDLLVDALAEAGFESFETEEEGLLKAYIPKSDYQTNQESIEAVLQQYGPFAERNDQCIEDQDWNAVWESSYPAVRFGDFCYVHAPFHEPIDGVKFNIRIEPKMSFGTAHHPTTALMIRFLEEHPPVGEAVLDMGCGTGVLGILAAMQGAKSVMGIDIDEWAYANALENVRANGLADKAGCSFHIAMGDARLLAGKRFDRIIANINRNILVRDMEFYASALNTGGSLYLSGFYREDMEMVEQAANAHRLFYKQHLLQDNWAAMKLLKK